MNQWVAALHEAETQARISAYQPKKDTSLESPGLDTSSPSTVADGQPGLSPTSQCEEYTRHGFFKFVAGPLTAADTWIRVRMHTSGFYVADAAIPTSLHTPSHNEQLHPQEVALSLKSQLGAYNGNMSN